MDTHTYEGWAKSSCSGAISFERQYISKWCLVIYKYDVFLAQVKSFSMMRSCIINVCTFQHEHGHPRYLGALQKTSYLNDTSCSYKPYFLEMENGNICKNMSDFRLTSVKTIQKVSDILSVSWCCAAPLFIHASIRDSEKKLCHFMFTWKPMQK